MKRQLSLPLFFIAFLVCMTTASFLNDVLATCSNDPYPCYEIDQQVIAHIAEAPYRYRILAPTIMSIGASPDVHWAWFSAGLAIHILCFILIDATLYSWLVPQVGNVKAIIGLCLMALVSIFAFHRYYLTPTSIIEVALLCLLLVLQRRWWFVVGIITIASLNRETALLLIVVYAVCQDKFDFRRPAILVAIWAIITAVLHISLGAAPHVLGLIGTFQANIARIGQSILINVLLLPLWIMVISGYRKSTTPLHKRLAWVSLVYMVAVAVGGMLDEVGRMALPVVVLTMPLVLESFSLALPIKQPNLNG